MCKEAPIKSSTKAEEKMAEKYISKAEATVGKTASGSRKAFQLKVKTNELLCGPRPLTRSLQSDAPGSDIVFSAHKLFGIRHVLPLSICCHNTDAPDAASR